MLLQVINCFLQGVIGGKTVPVNKVPEGKAFEGYMTKTFHGMTMPPGHRATMRTNAMMSSTLTGQTELPAKIMINFKVNQWDVMVSCNFLIAKNEYFVQEQVQDYSGGRPKHRYNTERNRKL